MAQVTASAQLRSLVWESVCLRCGQKKSGYLSVVSCKYFPRFFLFFCIFSFLAAPQHMEFPGQGSELNLSCSCGNTRSLTGCAGQGWNLCPWSPEMLPSHCITVGTLIFPVSHLSFDFFYDGFLFSHADIYIFYAS